MDKFACKKIKYELSIFSQVIKRTAAGATIKNC